MNKLRNWGAAGVTSLTLAAGQVHAALPAGITAALDSAETDGVALVAALSALGAAVFIIAKLLKRFGVMA